MRPKLLLFVWVVVLNSLFCCYGEMADNEGLIDIDEQNSFSQTPEKSKSSSGSDGGEDDEDYYGSGVMSDESGSGSGEPTTDSSIVDVSVVGPTTKEASETTQGETTTEISNEIGEGEDTEKPTEEIETTDEDIFHGAYDKSPNAEANAEANAAENEVDDKKIGEKVVKVLTTEVIAAVVVGAVCAVILIAFLVYRLRKRDEGSYALDAGYKDTYKLQADTGKEAFV